MARAGDDRPALIDMGAGEVSLAVYYDGPVPA
jgi:hypothetical protein